MEYDVVVVGGGPAGLAAACYALQAQLKVALVTPSLGGKVSHPFQLRGLPAVESVRGADLTEHLQAFVEARVTTFVPREAKHVITCRSNGFQLTLDNTDLISTRALIVCTGAQPQRLYVSGEQEFVGRGVSYSAISHAQFFRRRDVAVIGGDRALDAVVKLATIAKRVYYVLPYDVPNSPLASIALAHPNVIVIRNAKVEQIVGDEFVTGLQLTQTDGELLSLDVEGVFIELGLLPNNDLVADFVVLDDTGHIVIDPHCRTNIPGLYAAGDVTNVYAEQVPVAIGEGVKAALSAWSYLASHISNTQQRSDASLVPAKPHYVM